MPSVFSDDEVQDVVDENSGNVGYSDSDKNYDGLLTVKLSQSLHRKLALKASQEGVSIDDFATELLAEGLVLRAWEIMERKSHLRGGSQQPSGNGANHNGGNGNGGQNGRGGRAGGGFRGNGQQNSGGGGRRGGMSHSRYQTLMDDKAEFLEYVRNQERKQR